MNTAPTISIAMATFNGARFLDAQLDSLAVQTAPPAELVVLDDGSTDATQQIIETFAHRAPFPVRWHRNPERLGYRVSFVRAAERCRADLVAFCDQDDVWHPTKLAAAAAAFADPAVLLYHHAARVISADGEPLGPLVRHAVPPDVTPPHRSPPWAFTQGFSQVIRRTLIDLSPLQPHSVDIHEPDHVEAHDTLFFFLAATLGTTIHDPAQRVDYRQHATNVYGAGPGQLGRLARLHARLRSRLEDRGALYARLSHLATGRASMLDQIAAPHWRADAATGATRWRNLADLYAARHRLYAAGPAGRTAAMARLLHAHAYTQQGEWSFGLKGLAKDAALGLALAPLTRRYGFPGATSDPTCRAGTAQPRHHMQT